MDEGVILLDVTDPRFEEFARDFLERTGHPVLVCHGPPERTLCPLLAGQDCPKAADTHGIVFQFDLDRPQHRAILRRYRKVLDPDLPIRAIVRPGQEVRYAELLAQVQVWVGEPRAGDLDGFAAEVEAADYASSEST